MTRGAFGGSLWARRRTALEGDARLRGLDHVEVVDAGATLRLRLHFVPSRVADKSAAPPALGAENVQVEGPFGNLPATVRTVDAAQGWADVETPAPAADRAWVASAPFALRLVRVPDLDPFFAQATFRLDHAASVHPDEEERPPERASRPTIDYLAKDYASFRAAILDAMALDAPEWQERHAADLGMALVEILAYVGDGLSYYQDAVGTERYLETARLRSSVRRHLRLVGYPLHEGCNARVWMHVAVDAEARLPKGTAFLATPTLSVGPRVDPEALAGLLGPHVQVYESMHDAALVPEQNRIELYAWGADELTLPEGTVRATLRGRLGSLERGSVLVFEGHTEAGVRFAHAVRLAGEPHRGLDPVFGEPVTEIEWFEEDALPRALPVLARGRTDATTWALGNLVLADHGRRAAPEPLPEVPRGLPYRPALPEQGLTFACPYEHAEARGRSARATALQDPAEALGAVTVEFLSEGADTILWRADHDLLARGADDACFVVEVENHGTANLRFGDGVFGRRPSPGDRAVAAYRLGNGPSGDAAPNAIDRIATRDPRVMEVRNPLSASGGQEPESVARARLLAPAAAWEGRRCVTDDDYRETAEGLPGVARAFVRREIRATLPTVRVAVQREGRARPTEAFLRGVADALEPLRMLGTAVEVVPPREAPLAVEMAVRLWPDAPAGVRRRVAEALSSGEGGLFRPGGLSFGEALHASVLVERALRVDGVRSASVDRMAILGRPTNDGTTVTPRWDEILVLDTDARSLAGSLVLRFEGG